MIDPLSQTISIPHRGQFIVILLPSIITYLIGLKPFIWFIPLDTPSFSLYAVYDDTYIAQPINLPLYHDISVWWSSSDVEKSRSRDYRATPGVMPGWLMEFLPDFEFQSNQSRDLSVRVATEKNITANIDGDRG